MLSSLVKADRLAAHVGKTYAPFYELIARTLKSQAGNVDLHSATSISGNYKTIDDLPGPSLATTAYWLFVKGYADKSHAMQVRHSLCKTSFFFLQVCSLKLLRITRIMLLWEFKKMHSIINT